LAKQPIKATDTILNMRIMVCMLKTPWLLQSRIGQVSLLANLSSRVKMVV
jgi:hypothetical protein